MQLLSSIAITEKGLFQRSGLQPGIVTKINIATARRRAKENKEDLRHP